MSEPTHGGDLVTAQTSYSGEILDFSTTLNPLGMPPEAAEAAARAVRDPAYPDPQCRALRTALADRDGAAPDQILCGCGAAGLIYRLALALKPRRALITAPTFSEYEAALTLTGCQVLRHPLAASRNFDPDGALLDAIGPDLDLVFLCTPNNPTGRLIPPDLLAEAAARCRSAGAVLAVDECFLPL